MNRVRFKSIGWVYIPTTFMSIAVTILAIAFLVPVYAAIVENCHSARDNLYYMVVYTTRTAFCWKWIAEKAGYAIIPFIGVDFHPKSILCSIF